MPMIVMVMSVFVSMSVIVVVGIACFRHILKEWCRQGVKVRCNIGKNSKTNKGQRSS